MHKKTIYTFKVSLGVEFGGWSMVPSPTLPSVFLLVHSESSSLTIKGNDSSTWASIQIIPYWFHRGGLKKKKKKKEEVSWAPAIISLLPDCECHVTSHLMLLTPCPQHHDGLYPWPASQLNPSFLKCFCRALVTATRKYNTGAISPLHRWGNWGYPEIKGRVQDNTVSK